CSAAIKRPNQDPIYPFGIECAAMSYPAVRRCALIEHGANICLFVEGNLDNAKISDLRSHLSPLGVEQIKLISRIPVDKRHNAKIDYPELRKLIAGQSST
ncbi:MAG: AMP-dependent synthetase, partial [Verrucomicrobiae bacterium]|nr:AMP-dependent synthetase [Verrucomicrobiae bacterium]